MFSEDVEGKGVEEGLGDLGPAGIKYRNCRRRENGDEAKEKCGVHAWLVALHYINSTCGIERGLSISHRRLWRVPIDLFVICVVFVRSN